MVLLLRVSLLFFLVGLLGLVVLSVSFFVFLFIFLYRQIQYVC